MQARTIDVRRATCPGGGGLWSLLSHTRDVPSGGSLELLTDDRLATSDVPAWAERVGWGLRVRDLPDGRAFLVTRPG